jgi:hypothetical protein
MGCLNRSAPTLWTMWTTQERCPLRPQAHQQQQKRSIDVLPKADNLTCCLHVRAPEDGLYR